MFLGFLGLGVLSESFFHVFLCSFLSFFSDIGGFLCFLEGAFYFKETNKDNLIFQNDKKDPKTQKQPSNETHA